MTAEAKELYNYIMGNKKMTEAIKLNSSVKHIKNNIKAIVDASSKLYTMEYCSNDDCPFELSDLIEVTIKIVREITDFDEEEFEKCKELLQKFGIHSYDIFEPYEIKSRDSFSHLEVMGLFLEAWKFIEYHFTGEETFDEVYNNLSGERENGRFECMENYIFYGTDYFVRAFIISGSLVFAEIWNKSLDKVIAYVRMETV